MFLAVLFLIKTSPVIKNNENKAELQEGLTYNNEILGNLVNKDTDGDGVPDWEEGLWGTDPTKKETTPGIPDSVAIEKLKNEQNANDGTTLTNQNQNDSSLTQTDKFSREFLATIATLNQNGQMDQATIDKLSSSLADHIQNSPPRKVFLTSDMKVTKDDSTQAIKNYNNALENIQKKYPANLSVGVIDVLQEFSADQNNVDASVLSKLDPIISQTQGIIDGMVKIKVPQSMVTLHVDFINSFESLLENLNDIKLYDSDTIVALSAISQYDKNTTIMESAALKLSDEIEKRLNN